MNSKTFLTTMVIILALGGWYWFASSYNKSDNSIEDTEDLVDEISIKDKIVNDFVEQYQSAIEINLDKIDYTFQLENELVNIGKPVIFTAPLDDIFRKEGEIYMRFSPSVFSFLEPQIYYTLKGCGEKVDEILNKEKYFFEEYVVVAEITNIKKPIAQVQGIATGEYDVELELSESEIFLATGICIDLAYIEDSISDNLFD